MRRLAIKVMQVPSWAKWEWDNRDEEDPSDCALGRGKHPEIPPFFNRDGLYWNRRAKTCWIEYDGHAWADELNMFQYEFQYELKIEDWEILTEREEKALTEICKITRDTVLKKTLQKRLYEHTEHRYLKDLQRGIERRNGKPMVPEWHKRLKDLADEESDTED